MTISIKDEIHRLGCSDGYCDIAGKASGMHTNGGCHCLQNVEPELRIKLRKALQFYRMLSLLHNPTQKEILASLKAYTERPSPT